MATKTKRKGGKIKAKGHKVLSEFKRGTLKSSSGQKVTNPKQAVAIAFSEQREADKKKRRRSR